MFEHPVLARMVRKLESRAALADTDREALLALSFRKKILEPGAYKTREGDASQESALILEGYAFRQKLSQESGRQIVSFHISR